MNGVARRIRKGVAIAVLAVIPVGTWLAIRPDVRKEERPAYVERSWQDAVAVGSRLANNTIGIDIIEFSDLQCPYCRVFHEEAMRVRKVFPGVGLVLVHFPLPGHPQAQAAAIASECAGAQGRMPEFVEAVFRNQEGLREEVWTRYAELAQVPDLPGFARCIDNPPRAVLDRVANGLELGRRMSVTGTPTVLVNAMRFQAPPNLEALSDAIELAMESVTGLD